MPAGIKLTDAGAILKPGEPATVVYDTGTGAESAITVTLTSVREGKIADFAFFSLDAKAKASTPYYVRASVVNEGPAGLGGTALPFLAHVADNIVYPPTQLVGDFRPCKRPTLPKSFLKGQTTKVCYVFLVPEGQKLDRVELRTGKEHDAVRWTYRAE